MKRKKRIPVRWDQPGLHYDMEGLHYDQEFIEIEIDMIQIVLDLKNRSDTEVIQDVKDAAKALTEHAADFTGIDPSAADLTAAAGVFGDVLSANNTLQQAATNSTKTKNDARAVLEGTIMAAAAWTVANVTDATKAGNVWTLKHDRTATTSIDKVGNLQASFGDEPGDIHLAWNPPDKAQGYEIECKLAGGTWQHARSVGRKSNTDIHGLQSGQVYQFRVRALGPNDLQGPWSDIAEHMVP